MVKSCDFLEELDGYFKYNHLLNIIDETKLKKLVKKREEAFAKKGKISNIDGLIRHFLALKMFSSSTIILTSAQYSAEHNLQIVLPYYYYYALLNCSRAILFVDLTRDWCNGKLYKLTHQQIIRQTKDTLERFDRDYAKKYEMIINEAKDYRELFSYKFPVSGLNLVKGISLDDVIDWCSQLCEIAQFLSILNESFVVFHDSEVRSDDDLFEFSRYEIGGQAVFDTTEEINIVKMLKTGSNPHSLYMTITEGMTDYFFGSWCDIEENCIKDCYDPDKNWGLIFPFP